MKYPLEINDEMKEIFKNTYKCDVPESIEMVLIKLHAKGYSRIHCLFLLIDQLKITFKEANLIIMNAKAWR